HRQRLGTGFDRLSYPLLVDRPPALLLHPHPRAARAAAEGALAVARHLDGLPDRGHELSRSFPNVVVPREVARVVIGDRSLARHRSELALADEVGEKLRVMHDLVGASEIRILVAQRVETVRARGDDLLDARAVKGRDRRD